MSISRQASKATHFEESEELSTDASNEHCEQKFIPLCLYHNDTTTASKIVKQSLRMAADGVLIPIQYKYYAFDVCMACFHVDSLNVSIPRDKIGMPIKAGINAVTLFKAVLK
jgi:hypothetical protein